MARVLRQRAARPVPEARRGRRTRTQAAARAGGRAEDDETHSARYEERRLRRESLRSKNSPARAGPARGRGRPLKGTQPGPDSGSEAAVSDASAGGDTEDRDGSDDAIASSSEESEAESENESAPASANPPKKQETSTAPTKRARAGSRAQPVSRDSFSSDSSDENADAISSETEASSSSNGAAETSSKQLSKKGNRSGARALISPGRSTRSRPRRVRGPSEDSTHGSGDSEVESDVEETRSEPAASAGSAQKEIAGSELGSESGSDSGSDSGSESGSESDSASEEASEAESLSSDVSVDETRRTAYFLKGGADQSAREDETVARFKYLFSLGDIFRQFVDLRARKDRNFKALVDRAGGAARSKPKPKARRTRGRKHKQAKDRGEVEIEEEEIEEFEEEIGDDSITVFTESPRFLNGTLRPYQIDGLNWLVQLYVHNLNGIFADEMGLGKTFQCISFLAYLRHIQNIRGPHLVIVPKSTVQNWAREFAQWSPEAEVCVLTGNKEERGRLIRSRVLTARFDVLITSFELVIREKATLQKIAWEYTIVDEAHRIKNEESILSKIMRILFSRHRLLITGTPLQNNLHELWALLNFLLPDVFSDSSVFDEWFTQRDEGQGKVVEQLRALLSPFLLRRVKSDVEHSLLPKKEINLYVGMTDMQVQWYQRLLKKDLDAVNNVSKLGESKMRLLNVVMQLRKCCNHPYLFDGAEPGPPFTTDEHLVYNSGKMIYLDKLLQRLKAQGSRVLIFSQMARMLDILEDYCSLRDYEYCRIDGSTSHEDRISAIDEYNKKNSEKFIFLLTTRAGGLGINLTTADQVVIYDSDWNPQADLQAMDRAHRIGQTKQVWVYRFIVENAIEEKVLERAAQKLRLDQLVIQQPNSSAQEKAKANATKDELANMIRHGAQEVFDRKGGTINNDLSIEDIISAGEKRTQELNAKYSGLGLNELREFTFDAPPTQPVIVNAGADEPTESDFQDYRHHPRRARNAAMYTEEQPEAASKVHIRAPKQLVLHDYQFFPPELKALQEKELTWYRHRTGFRLSAEDFSSDEEDESEAINKKIEEAEPFTEEDSQLKEKLLNEGFMCFTKRDFFHFINVVARYGGQGSISDEKWPEIVADWPGKTIGEVKRYYKVFFERYKEIQDYERYMGQLEAGESKTRRQNERMLLLAKKVASSRTPLTNLHVSQPSGGSSARNRFSEANDRFLVVEMNRIGLDTEDLFDTLRERIRTCGLFDYDWYFMSRTTSEISRRCTSLLNLIVKELSTDAGAKPTDKRRRTIGDKEKDAKKVKSES